MPKTQSCKEAKPPASGSGFTGKKPGKTDGFITKTRENGWFYHVLSRKMVVLPRKTGFIQENGGLIVEGKHSWKAKSQSVLEGCQIISAPSCLLSSMAPQNPLEKAAFLKA